MFKHSLLLFIAVLVWALPMAAQDQESHKGKVFGTIYFDAFTDAGAGYKATAMEIKRAYFGYKYHYNKELQAYLKLDIGSPNDISAFSLLRRYAYFKNAGLKYHHQNLTVNVGITDVLMYKIQEKYWAHRYIAKSFLDRYHFGPKADIGANIAYRFNDAFSLDLGIYNGEGYKNLQSDNSYRSGLGITIYPFKNLLTRLYLDMEVKATGRYTFVGFVGYRYKKLLILGAEYNYQKNHRFMEQENMFGYSLYGSWNINEKWQLFARYDLLNSNILYGEDSPWHLSKDGSALISGVQYRIYQGILVAINYQDWVPYATNMSNEYRLFLNMEIKF